MCKCVQWHSKLPNDGLKCAAMHKKHVHSKSTRQQANPNVSNCMCATLAHNSFEYSEYNNSTGCLHVSTLSFKTIVVNCLLLA